jgi:hypothetical protein
MHITNKIINLSLFTALVAGIFSCQKMDQPSLGDFPEDVLVTPATPLRFYINFDSATANDNQINVRFKDSISGYPSFFPDASIKYGPGVRGTSYTGNTNKSLTYYNSNDFAKSTSFSVAFWEKHDGVPTGEAQFAFSIPSSAGHWSGGTMFLLFDHTGSGATTDQAVIKFFVLDATGENWFELVGNDRMPHIYDNQWHHLAFAYDEASSSMKFYRDGELWATKSWGSHGSVKMEDSKVTSFLLGGKCVSGWGAEWGGSLDQFRMYNKALSEAEVKTLYSTQF